MNDPRQLTVCDERPLSSLPQIWLGFSVEGDVNEIEPIFNYARVWTHMTAAEYIAEAFLTSAARQKIRQSVISDRARDEAQDGWGENLQGKPQDMSMYISPKGKDVEDLRIHASASACVIHNCINAALVAMFLQWGTTGAAIVITLK